MFVANTFATPQGLVVRLATLAGSSPRYDSVFTRNGHIPDPSPVRTKISVLTYSFRFS
jgi:hypothetical protein